MQPTKFELVINLQDRQRRCSSTCRQRCSPREVIESDDTDDTKTMGRDIGRIQNAFNVSVIGSN
jgi:hypothetical protein